MEIRAAKSQDTADMIGLLKHLFEIEADFEFNPAKHYSGLTEIINSPDCCAIVAINEHQTIVGMCMAQCVISTATGKKSAWLEDLIVTPSYRGEGIGKHLVKHTQEWAEQQGCNRIQLVYDLENYPAIEFYKNQDFKQTQLGVFSKKI